MCHNSDTFIVSDMIHEEDIDAFRNEYSVVGQKTKLSSDIV